MNTIARSRIPASFALASGLVIAFSLSISFAHAETNLILNADFETAGVGGIPAHWVNTYWGNRTPAFAYPAAGHTGSGVSVTLDAKSNGDARWQPDAVSVEAGATYTYSAWYKSNVASEIDTEFAAPDGTLSYGWVADVPSSGNAWKQITASFTVPAGVARASVFQILWKKGTLTVDDVSLSKDGGTTPPPSAPTLAFSASPESIQDGGSAVLSWEAANATGCTAGGGWSGSKNTSGTETVSPAASATYSLTCTGEGGTVSKEAAVTVESAPLPPTPAPTITLTASPGTIDAGASSALSWQTADATSCTASGGWTGAKATGGTENVSPAATATYTLSCSGDGGSATRSATVTVNASAPAPGQFPTGLLTFSFDDSWDTQYLNALPILEAAGMKATFYLTTQPIQEGWDEFMTPAMVKDIAAKGYEIADHTRTHADLTTLGRNKIKNEITNSRTYLRNLTGAAVDSIAYPYGSVNNTVKNLVKQAGYTSARGVDDEVLNTTATDAYELESRCVETSDSLDSIRARIDEAKAKKEWYILCFHEIKDSGGDEYTTTLARFRAIVEYAAQSGIPIVTIGEGRALMH